MLTANMSQPTIDQFQSQAENQGKRLADQGKELEELKKEQAGNRAELLVKHTTIATMTGTITAQSKEIDTRKEKISDLGEHIAFAGGFSDGIMLVAGPDAAVPADDAEQRLYQLERGMDFMKAHANWAHWADGKIDISQLPSDREALTFLDTLSWSDFIIN
jgi:hypothetical protein